VVRGADGAPGENASEGGVRGGTGPAMAGEHDRESNQVCLFIKVNRLHVLVIKGNLNIIRDRGCKADGPVRRKMEFRLPCEFGP